jgi:hypothetical protein
MKAADRIASVAKVLLGGAVILVDKIHDMFGDSEAVTPPAKASPRTGKRRMKRRPSRGVADR